MSSDSAKWLARSLSKEVDDISTQPQSMEELRRALEDQQKKNQALRKERQEMEQQLRKEIAAKDKRIKELEDQNASKK